MLNNENPKGIGKFLKRRKKAKSEEAKNPIEGYTKLDTYNSLDRAMNSQRTNKAKFKMSEMKRLLEGQDGTVTGMNIDIKYMQDDETGEVTAYAKSFGGEVKKENGGKINEANKLQNRANKSGKAPLKAAMKEGLQEATREAVREFLSEDLKNAIKEGALAGAIKSKKEKGGKINIMKKDMYGSMGHGGMMGMKKKGMKMGDDDSLMLIIKRMAKGGKLPMAEKGALLKGLLKDPKQLEMAKKIIGKM